MTRLEKKLIIAQVIQKAVLAIFKTHTYGFANTFFLQRRGGQIGLRSTCCIARLVIMWWDRKFIEAIQKSNLSLIEAARYMEDVRVWLHWVILGWRWHNGELTFRSAWRLEEKQAGMTILEKTTEIMEKIMSSICGWLRLTMENEDMFGGVLPTLDLNIWVADNNVLLL